MLTMKKSMLIALGVFIAATLAASTANADTWKVDIKCNGDWSVSYDLFDGTLVSLIAGPINATCVNEKVKAEHDTGLGVVVAAEVNASEVVGASTCRSNHTAATGPIKQYKTRCETKSGRKEKMDFKAKKK
jgi:hypothetical protein